MEPHLKLGGDNWMGSRCQEWEVLNPERTTIQNAIRCIDGRTRTEVTVSYSDPFQCLAIGGGPDLFVVTGERADESVVTLKNRAAGGREVELVCGGQRASFRLTDVVDLETALDAMESFINGFPGGLGPEWEVQA
jgi:hypothetical protein